MLTYINENIHKPEHLKVAHLASIFMMSPTYVSEFLNKFTCLCENTFLRRIKLVEIRLLNSDYTLTEIADELGFTDVSHLSKPLNAMLVNRYVNLK
jgi:AraC-like DNA-binding protein